MHWRKFLVYLKPHRGMVFLMFLGGSLALAAATAIPLVIKQAIDGPMTHRRPLDVLPYAALLVGLAVAEFGFTFLRRNLAGIASFRMETALRNDFYAHLQDLHVGFHDNWQSGQLLSRAVADINSIRRFIGFGLVFGFVMLATFVVVVALLFTLNPLLAAITGLTVLPVIALSRRFFIRYRTVARRVQDQQGDLTTVVEEAATGIRIIKAFGRADTMIERFRTQAAMLRESQLEAVRVRAGLWTLMSYVPNLNLALILLLGGFAVINGALTVGGLVAFMSYLFMLIGPMDGLGWILAMAEEASTAADRISEVLDSRPEIADRPGARALTEVRGAVRFENLGFRFPGGDFILRGLDLEVRAGETMALVGRTGSGKTTLASLVPRLHDAVEGRVTLDGVDVRDLTLSSLRSHVGIAFEDPILFSASVRENLIMGRPATTDEEIDRALRIAQAGFVDELPWGLETRVGEQGFSLSGGQRQRLALARAVLGRPQVLVLDDPMSAVDVHTEAMIEVALASVLKGVTALLIVHRPSTLALADRVALLDGGRIVAVATHSELMAGNDLYRALLSQAAEALPGALEEAR